MNYGDLEAQYSLPNGILSSIRSTESANGKNLLSDAGALGDFQFMPSTAKAYGINPLDPAQAADGAARMLADLGRQYKGNWPAVVAHYNGGSAAGKAVMNGQAPPAAETQAYIPKVMAGVSKSAPMSVQDAANVLGIAPKAQQAAAPNQQSVQDAAKLLGLDASAPVQPEKGFGAQLSDTLADVPRQVGLTARYGLQGVGGILDAASSPIRAGLNALGMNIQGGSGQVLADTIGLPKPKNDLEKVVGSASELVAGGAVPVALAAKAVPLTTGATQGVMRMLAANPGAQAASNAAAGAAGEYTKQTGGGEGAQMAASLAAGLLAPAALAGGQKAVSALKNAVTPARSNQAIDVTIQNLIDNGDYGIQYADIGNRVKQQLRNDIGSAMNNGTLDSDAARRLIDYRLVGATPTRGSLTLNPVQITQEKNLAKIGANSTDATLQGLAGVQNENNATFINRLNDLGANTPQTQYDAGGRILAALDNTDQAARSAISDAYSRARDSAGRSANLDPSAFTQRAGNLLNQANAESFLPTDIRNTLNRIAQGQMPLNVEIAEQLKTNIGRIQRASADGNVRHSLGLVRQALDETPLMSQRAPQPVPNQAAGTGIMTRRPGELNALAVPAQSIGQDAIDAFNQARNLNRTYMQQVEGTPALQALRDGVQPDKFVQNFIIGQGGRANVADLQALRAAVQQDPGALQTIRGQIAKYLKEQSISGKADEVGKVSSSSLNKAIANIGDQKLGMFFSPEEVAQLKSLGRVSSYEQFQPVGSAVNNSNSGALALSGALDFIANNKILSRIPGADTFIRQPIRNFTTQVGINQALNVPSGLLSAPPVRQRAIPAGLLTAPLLLPANANSTKQE